MVYIFIPLDKNSLFSDPLPGIEKHLFIKDVDKHLYFNENQSGFITVSDHCEFFYGIDGKYTNVSHIVWNFHNFCIPIDKNAIFGDPFPGTMKKFIIKTECGCELIFNENESEIVYIIPTLTKFYYGTNTVQIDVLEKIKELLSTSKISCNLMGGLGNQLFQIFTLLNYSIKVQKDFCLPSALSYTTSAQRTTYWDNIFQSLVPFINYKDLDWQKYEEPSFNYHSIPFFNSNYQLHGYFQSYKYFEENNFKIYSLLNFADQITTLKNKYYLNKNFTNTISLHFRLGDYINLQQNHPILPISYYKSCLIELQTRTNKKSWNVLYFFERNDVSIVNNSISLLEKQFSDINFEPVKDIQDYEQMLIMSCCQHNIIANSSFSWWGAYIGSITKESKIICYPSLWFGPDLKKDTKDLFPSNWTKINIY